MKGVYVLETKPKYALYFPDANNIRQRRIYDTREEAMHYQVELAALGTPSNVSMLAVVETVLTYSEGSAEPIKPN